MARRPDDFKGMDLVSPLNRILPGRVPVAVNVRAYIRGGYKLRNVLGAVVISIGSVFNTIARLNDTTPAGPTSGYSIVISAEVSLFSNTTQIAVGMSGDQVSMLPFRPNTSVQVWMYVSDNSQDVNIYTKFAINGAATVFNCFGQVKVRSDGLIYKTGIKEPQLAPTVSTSGTTSTGSGQLHATSVPWTNVGGANTTFYNYGQTNGADGTSPFIILTPPGSQTLTVAVSGTATVNGVVHQPGDPGPATSSYPAQFTGANPTIVVGVFTDGSGNVLAPGGPVPVAINIGFGAIMQVPAGAVQFQLGVDSSANNFSANSDTPTPFMVNYTLVSSAIATVVSTLGQVTAYVFGDSPHSGPVATYIWKNPNDTGTGTPRTVGNASATVTNNSWLFDSTPEDGTVPMQWSTLNSSGTVTGSIPLFTPALETEGYQDWNMCVTGTIFIPAAGTYAFTFKNKDQIMVGVSGSVTSDAGTKIGNFGQTISVVSGLPLVYVSSVSGSGGAITQVVHLTFPGPGSYQIEIDYDYWFHTGRSLSMLVNGVNVPPAPSGARTEVSYACKYLSSVTGARSNPGPTSTPQVTPVLDNTVSCPYSPDPQVDKVIYYRQDNGLANYTEVAIGPNTNPPTPIIDSLSDLAAADNEIMTFDDYEPVPSIDLPRSGTCNVSGGVITQLSGDLFNLRWLPGTIIEIGAPPPYGQPVVPQLAYALIARPTSTTTMTIPEVPDGLNLIWNIPEPILANQPLPYMWGPTDNINYAFQVGDPLRPGTLYWSKGSNLDSWPDTNQQDVTDPSEALVNGAMSGGLGVLFSIKRAWIILPNFFNALATVTGTTGSTWTLQDTSIERGLFIPRCLCVAGGGKIFFRVDDGIHVSRSGAASVSITNDDLYPLFPHESPGSGTSAPTTIVRNGVTFFPPDDSNPDGQKFSYQNGYMYYDYLGTDGNRYSLVYDVEAEGWVWDIYAPPVITRAPNEGESQQGMLCGCADGSVRLLELNGTEGIGGTVVTPAMGGVGYQTYYEWTVEYKSNDVVNITPIVVDVGNGSYVNQVVTLPSTGGGVAKSTFKVGPNKWKLVQFDIGSLDPTMEFYLEGFIIQTKPWGSTKGYEPIAPFKSSGGHGGQG